MFMNIILSKYYHYPELHINLKIIIVTITTSIPSDLIVDAVKLYDIPKSIDCFEPYRNKMRGHYLLLNNFHLNFLYNITTMVDDIKEEPNDTISDVIKDFSLYYEPSIPEENYRSKYEDFKVKKQKEIEVHELTLKIGFNLTKLDYTSKWLLNKTCFVDDILDFLVYFQRGEILNGESKDVVEYISILKKKKSTDSTKITLLSILELTLNILVNFLSSEDEAIGDRFLNKVIIIL